MQYQVRSLQFRKLWACTTSQGVCFRWSYKRRGLITGLKKVCQNKLHSSADFFNLIVFLSFKTFQYVLERSLYSGGQFWLMIGMIGSTLSWPSVSSNEARRNWWNVCSSLAAFWRLYRLLQVQATAHLTSYLIPQKPSRYKNKNQSWH